MRKIVVYILATPYASHAHAIRLTEPPQRTDIVEAVTAYTLRANAELQEIQESFARLAQKLQDIRENLTLEDKLKAIVEDQARAQIQEQEAAHRRTWSARRQKELLSKGHPLPIYWHRIRSNPG